MGRTKVNWMEAFGDLYYLLRVVGKTALSSKEHNAMQCKVQFCSRPDTTKNLKRRSSGCFRYFQNSSRTTARVAIHTEQNRSNVNQIT